MGKLTRKYVECIEECKYIELKDKTIKSLLM